eukprot:TRINITY_DN33075_c0_g1_i1.p1 TRINITY_DN33075_c0_g1~~TRINITY_DN33075_c0_g1_i1.p1  ORF type:complete len:118 (+),score=15.79 TRINITY_DN33075_c0_g1_i1:266-619(+)
MRMGQDLNIALTMSIFAMKHMQLKGVLRLETLIMFEAEERNVNLEKVKECCLMYKCQIESKIEDDEDTLENLFEESPEEKDSIRSNENQSTNTETTLKLDNNNQESNSELQKKLLLK